jgi:hypothetical protein
VMGLRRLIIPVPFLSVGLSSYWLNIFTPVPFSVAASLIKGVRCEVLVQNDNAQKLFNDIHPAFLDKVLRMHWSRLKTIR